MRTDPLTPLIPSCHPDRSHFAKSLCAACYNQKRYSEKRDEILEQKREYHQNNKEKRNAYMRQYTEKTKERRYAYNRQYQSINFDRLRVVKIAWHAKTKEDVIRHYSEGTMACRVCGINDLDVLCLDHLNNNGRLHQKTRTGSSNNFQWAYQNNYPPIFQVLCHNCNMKKQIVRLRQEGPKRRVRKLSVPTPK